MAKPRYVIISVRSIDPSGNYESLRYALPKSVGDGVLRLLGSRNWKRLHPCSHYQGLPGDCLANAQNCVEQLGGAMAIVMTRCRDKVDERHLSPWNLFMHAAWTDGRTITDPTRQLRALQYAPASDLLARLFIRNGNGRVQVVPYAFSFAHTLQGVQTVLSPRYDVRRSWVYDVRERALADHGLCFPPLFRAA